MKSGSVVVAMVVVFSATVMMGYSEAQYNNCSNAVRRLSLKPCLSQIETLIPGTIDSSCCAAVSEVTNECPIYFQSYWISRANKVCSTEVNLPDIPNLTPPPQSKPGSPPEEDVNDCDTSPIQPCAMSLLDFGNGRSLTISEDCCTIFTGLQSKCGPTHKWSDFALQCLDYCHNHYH